MAMFKVILKFNCNLKSFVFRICSIMYANKNRMREWVLARIGWSENTAGGIMPLITFFDLVLAHDPLPFSLGAILHGDVVEIGEQFIIIALDPAIVSNCDTGLIVTKNTIILDLREAWTRTNYATSLVFMDLIVRYVHTAIE